MGESLFPELETPQRRVRATFSNYDEWISHFTENPKTTDECWTPPDVYEAVLDFVRSRFDCSGREIVRPFFPGGDYENTEYPEGCVVVDNPPFSLFKRITKFYEERKIPFFIFGNGFTIGSADSKIVFTGAEITYENGAKVPTEFATNLPCFPYLSTAPELGEAIASCPSQESKKARLKSYEYPEEVLTASDMRAIAERGVRFEVENAHKISCLEGRRLFGGAWLVSKAKAKEKIPLRLSERERRIVAGLDADCRK